MVKGWSLAISNNDKPDIHADEPEALSLNSMHVRFFLKDDTPVTLHLSS